MIPRSYVENFTRGINAISEQARAALDSALEGIDLSGDVADVRRQVVSVMQGICGTSTDATAQLAAQFYDGLRYYEIGETMGAQPTSGRDSVATEGAVRAFADKLVKGNPDAFVNLLRNRVDYEIKVAASQTCLENAKRDRRKPRFARVPTGIETCDFCLMLASRGFVYHTEATASHAHSSCDCRIVPSWKSQEVEGYDPEAIYDQWQDAITAKAAERAERNGTDVDDELQKIMDTYARSAAKARGRSYSSVKPYRPEESENFVPDDKAKKQAEILLRGLLSKKRSAEEAMEQIVKAQEQWDKSVHTADMDNYFADRVKKIMVHHGLSTVDLANYASWLLKMK